MLLPKQIKLEQSFVLDCLKDRSRRPFRLGDATGNTVVRIPFGINLGTKFFVNLVSRSCLTMAGFIVQLPVRSMNSSVCSVTQAEFGHDAEDEIRTSLVFMDRKAVR